MDVISNMLITIKNGGNAGKQTVAIPFSKYKNAIAKSLLDSGYIKSYEKKAKNKGADILEIELKYEKETGKHTIKDVKRISKPSRRLYIRAKEITPVREGSGAVFLSTPKGILTGKQAQKEQVGGEILFEIW